MKRREGGDKEKKVVALLYFIKFSNSNSVQIIQDAAVKTEEITRTEEVERTVKTRKKKDSSRSRHRQQEMMTDYGYQNGGGGGGQSIVQLLQ